ncbi:hypothetical protein EJD97_008127 [Solanum chilense]|uniref:CCHC-type domain-containing protein n=1 Tax=Solanum chilense TaxID=4083 RepID=A0A6N2CFM0_SOLCI|nr:hypothetical protein EJD97_008127 [Solanum chilense]
MNTRGNAGRRVKEVADWGNKAPPQAPTARVQVHVTPAALTDGESTIEGAPKDNPHSSTIARRLRDFTRMNPPVYFGSKTNEDPQEFVWGVNEEEKAKLATYQLKDVAQVEESLRLRNVREVEKCRPSIMLVLAMVGVLLESMRGPSSRRGTNTKCDRKSCGNCGRSYGGECIVGSNSCYGCGKSGHMIRKYAYGSNQAKEDTQPQPNPTAAAKPL